MEGKSLLFAAEQYRDAHAFCKTLIDKYCKDKKFSTLIEIGGSVAQNCSTILCADEYYNVDIKDNTKIPTIVCDCTKKIPLPSNSVDFVFSNDTFEHLEKPWVTASEITRILRKGGYTFIGTLFSWRYHPVPGDHYRFTPSGLCALFPELTMLEANFCSGRRRDDIRGFWPNKKDSVPVDILGGWRENWKVFYFGQKP